MKHRKTYRYRLYPTRRQAHTLQATLDECRGLYNAALQERRDAYRLAHKSLSFAHQSAELPECKKERPELDAVYSQTLQDVLHRLDRAFSAFFRRVGQGQKPGYPRFQGRSRYDSITYPQYGNGATLAVGEGKWGTLTLSKLGALKVKLHRPPVGSIKTVTIKREGPRWYVCFSVEYQLDVLDHSGPPVGIDVGLEYYASLSTGEQIANPRYFRKSARCLARAQRKLARLSRTHPKRRKAARAVALAHRKSRNQRKDFQHKLSRRLAKQYSLLCVEELGIVNMSRRCKPVLDEARSEEWGQAVYAPNGQAAKSGLNKSIQDAAWRAFTDMLAYKAEEAGGKLVFTKWSRSDMVRAAGTSQECPECQRVVPKTLGERRHRCECGCDLPRDVASSYNGIESNQSNRIIGLRRVVRFIVSKRPGPRSRE